MPLYLVLPLVAAFLYALSSIFIKRGLRDGATTEEAFHLNNLAVGLLFLPLLFLESQEIAWSQWPRPVLTGVAFFIGGWLTFVAIQRGDVSLVTPLLGTKVVFVALGVVLFTGKNLSLALWVATFLTATGIFLIGFRDARGGRHVAFTAAITLTSAAIFGICDVMIVSWAPDFGPLAFLTVSSMVVGVGTVIMWLCQGRPQLLPPRGPRGWTLAGGVIVALQAIMLGCALSLFNDATRINVVYASRGLWAVALVFWVGTHFGNHERHSGDGVFAWRLIGTVLLFAAMVIAVVERSS